MQDNKLVGFPKCKAGQEEKNESIAVFGDEIRLYSQKAYMTLDSEAQEMLALQHFYKNVSPEMRCLLMERDCKNIREAVEIVERYEEIMGKTNQGSSHVRAVSDNKTKGENRSVNCKDTIDGEHIQAALKRIELRLEKLESNKTRRVNERTCYTCGSTNHFYRNCPQNVRARDGGRLSTNQENSHPSLPK